MDSKLDISNASNRLLGLIDRAQSGELKEVTDEFTKEVIETSLDVFYCLADGSLWNEAYVQDLSQTAGPGFVNGTDINFLPIVVDLGNGINQNIAIFTFNQLPGQPLITDTLTAVCEFDENSGHKVLSVVGGGASGLGADKLAPRIAGMAYGAMYKK